LLARPASAIPAINTLGSAESVELSATELQIPLSQSDSERHFDVRRSGLVDRHGRAAGWLVSLRDVTDRQNVERERLRNAHEQMEKKAADAARERSEFMADATRQLTQSLDVSATAQALANLVAPALAAWCA